MPLLDLLTSMIFSRVNVVVDEPSTYQQGSSIPEWQLAMSEKLAALDRTSTWDLFFYCHMGCYIGNVSVVLELDILCHLDP